MGIEQCLSIIKEYISDLKGQAVPGCVNKEAEMLTAMMCILNYCVSNIDEKPKEYGGGYIGVKPEDVDENTPHIRIVEDETDYGLKAVDKSETIIEREANIQRTLERLEKAEKVLGKIKDRLVDDIKRYRVYLSRPQRDANEISERVSTQGALIEADIIMKILEEAE